MSLGSETSPLPIPHRPPFLFVDQVLERTEKTLKATKTFSGQEDFFQGHYPDYPILPGVIACEAIFQAGAILMAHLLETESPTKNVPVLTRITSAKFREQILPPATLEIQVEFKEKMLFAYTMKGSIRCQGKKAVEVEFIVASVESKK